MVEIPKPAGIMHVTVTIGVLAIGVFVGFVMGDIADLHSLGVELLGAAEGQLPFSSKVDYASLIAAIPYAIGIGIVHFLRSKIGQGGMWSTAVFRTGEWFLWGVVAHLFLTWLLPARVSAGPLTLPAIVR